MRLLLPTPPLPVNASTRGGFAGRWKSGQRRGHVVAAHRLAEKPGEAASRVHRQRSRTASAMSDRTPLAQEVDDLRQGTPGSEDAGDTHLQELRRRPLPE